MDRVQGIPTNGDPSGTSEIWKLLPPTGLQGAIVLEPVEELEPGGGVTAQRLIEIQPLHFPNCGKTWREQRNESPSISLACPHISYWCLALAEPEMGGQDAKCSSPWRPASEVRAEQRG